MWGAGITFNQRVHHLKVNQDTRFSLGYLRYLNADVLGGTAISEQWAE